MVGTVTLTARYFLAQDSNKYRVTALGKKVQIVLIQRNRCPDWPSTVKALQDIYGKQKRPVIYRWVAAAKTVPAAVLARVDSKSIPHNFAGYSRQL